MQSARSPSSEELYWKATHGYNFPAQGPPPSGQYIDASKQPQQPSLKGYLGSSVNVQSVECSPSNGQYTPNQGLQKTFSFSENTASPSGLQAASPRFQSQYFPSAAPNILVPTFSVPSEGNNIVPIKSLTQGAKANYVTGYMGANGIPHIASQQSTHSPSTYDYFSQSTGASPTSYMYATTDKGLPAAFSAPAPYMSNNQQFSPMSIEQAQQMSTPGYYIQNGSRDVAAQSMPLPSGSSSPSGPSGHIDFAQAARMTVSSAEAKRYPWIERDDQAGLILAKMGILEAPPRQGANGTADIDLAPKMEEIENDWEAEEGEIRVDCKDFLRRIYYLWEANDVITVASLVMGSANGVTHLGSFVCNRTKGNEYYFIDKARACNPEGFRVYFWGDRMLKQYENADYTFYRSVCNPGAGKRLKAMLARQYLKQFHPVYDNCHHFERELRAAAIGVRSTVLNPHSWTHTFMGDFLRGVGIRN